MLFKSVLMFIIYDGIDRSSGIVIEFIYMVDIVIIVILGCYL